MFKNSISFRAVSASFLMLFAMWSGFALQNFGFFNNCEGAIIPLVPEGLNGVLFSPLLHGNWDHIISNSLPMGILLFLLFQFYEPVALKVFIIGWLASGLVVWLLPPMNLFADEMVLSCIIGASGLIYVLAFFLFFSGVFRKDKKLLTISLLVALYFGSMIWGIFPEEFFMQLNEPSRVSWQSHLTGAVIGVFLAFYFRKNEKEIKKYIWEYPNYYNEKDDKIWQEYIETHPEDFEEMPKLKKNDIWDHLEELRGRKRF